MNWLKELLNLIALFASYVEHPGDGPAKKEQVKQMLQHALPAAQWKVYLEYFDFILNISIVVLVMLLKKRFWKSAMKVLAK